MSKPVIAALCLSLFAHAALAQSEPPTAEAPPEQILVVGQKPGPGLWKVTKDDHVMWVFGTYAPLPKKMEWRSQQVENIIAQSQEMLTAPYAELGVGFLRSLTLLPFMIGMDKNPDGKTLHDLLPADTYERWLVLRKKYLKDDADYDRKRPFFVAGELTEKAAGAAGLSLGKDVRDKLLKLAKQNNVKITPVKLELPVDSPVKAVRDFKKSTLDDVACLARTIDLLETDVSAYQARANAWAKGDIAGIRALDFSEQDSACSHAVEESTVMKERGLTDIDARVRKYWLETAGKALAANRSTFAVLPIERIVGKDSYLAALEAQGYKVEQPE
ncbi:uncharacterized protein YbaP (TraB family) [Pseudoduganella flava]|uniref:TraB/GumN family protein n=1 Tax=Pseudoduganella flava TaxID=871742 RepID=A0A562PWR4_9BURK|nr:TraB/GumN family protein [Pseudoduganella flava]QGZ39955.1 TraB/GumN family protein [Pseudoduganella flava]TWI48891.1 uncharacterized protein YbaP (TraB family) [Pseudoduganella flava]